MERKNRCGRAGFSKILWALSAILLCAAPGLRAEDVTVPAGEVWVIPSQEHPGPIVGTLWVEGTANLLTGASVSQSIEVQANGTLNMYSGTVNWYINVYPGAAGVTIYGTGFADQAGAVDYGGWTPTGGMETLTGSYADESAIYLWIWSDTPINLQPPAGPPSNQDPVAVDDGAQTELNTPVTIDVLTNDYDPDEGDQLAVESFTQGTYGSVANNGDGSVTYTPNLNFVGSDTFEYTITDGKGGTASATVTVTVNTAQIEIDIKPGSYPNAINLGSNGVVPVAILSTPDLDATTLPPENVFLAGSGVAVRGKGNKYLASTEDVNGDSLPDLVPTQA